jgi:hypothetical protein
MACARWPTGGVDAAASALAEALHAGGLAGR